MTSTEVRDEKQSRRASILIWVARLGAFIGYGVGPWASSLLASRHGWATGLPGVWNLLGLIPVMAGTACPLWTVDMHCSRPEGVRLQRAQNYLLTHGPYAFTRHPAYLSEVVLLLGWAVFYGSVVVFIGFLIAVVVFNLAAIGEERAMEARFGEAYRRYKSKVPRWLEKTRSRVRSPG